MKVRIRVGAVEVDLEGVDLTRRQVRALMFDAAGLAAMLDPDPVESAPLGFSAHVERLPDDLAEA